MISFSVIFYVNKIEFFLRVLNTCPQNLLSVVQGKHYLHFSNRAVSFIFLSGKKDYLNSLQKFFSNSWMLVRKLLAIRGV